MQFRQWLDDTAGALGGRNALYNVFLFFKQSFALQPLNDYLARFDSFLTLKTPFDNHFRVFIYNSNFMREQVTVSYLPVGMTVSGR